MRRGPDGITVAIVVGALALGMTLSHAQATHGDHARIAQLQRDVEQLSERTRKLDDHLGVVDDRDHSQLAELYGDVHGLQDREKARRASRTRRLVAAPQRPTSSVSWATSRDAVRVANCESGELPHWPDSSGEQYVGDAHLRDPNGHGGKWQFAPATWRSVGGSGRAYDAPESEQDYRAWLLWKRDGWQPWTCARKLGVR